jgi:septal ring-binding cell division protein DamX
VALEPEKAARFISDHPLSGQVASYRVPDRDTATVAIVYGSYAQRSAAIAAAEELRGRIAGIKPWVRSIRAIQASLAGSPDRLPVVAARPSPSSTGPTDDAVEQAETWLRAQDPSHFTVQLLVMEPGKVERFVADHGLEGRVARYRAARGDELLLGLIYGSFATRAEATVAAQDLQGEIKGIKPWVRTIGGLQERMIAASPAAHP